MGNMEDLICHDSRESKFNHGETFIYLTTKNWLCGNYMAKIINNVNRFLLINVG